MKNFQNFIFVLGMSGVGLEGFWGTLGNRRRVGRVGRRIDSASSERMRATSGKSLYVAPFYEKLGLIQRVAGNSLRSANIQLSQRYASSTKRR